MLILRALLIYSMMFLGPVSASAQVVVGDRTYHADQTQVNQQSEGYTNQTTQAVGDEQRGRQIESGTQAQNIQGGGSGLGKSLIIAGAGSVAAALLLAKIGTKKVVQGKTEVAVANTKAAAVTTAPLAPPWYKKAALSFAIAGGMMAMSLLAARQGKSNYDQASQAFDTAAVSSWCGQATCPDYNPNYPPGPNPNFPDGDPDGGGPGGPGSTNGNGLVGDGSDNGGMGRTLADGGDGGSRDSYLTPEQRQARANVKAMIAREQAKANALISQLEKQGYKMSADGKTLTTPNGSINPQSMSSAEGMKSAGFSDEAIKGIEENLKNAAAEAAKIVAAKEAELGGMDEGGGSGGSQVAGMDTSSPSFDPSKFLNGLNLNGTPAQDRAPAGLAIQLSSGETIGSRTDNIFAMVQRAYKIQQRTGQLGPLRQPAQQRPTGPGPAAPMGF